MRHKPDSNFCHAKNNIRKMKMDTVDTQVIARALMTQPHRLYASYDIDMMHIKTLGCSRQKLIKQRTCTKIQLTAYLHQTFPELQYFFNVIRHKSMYALLKKTPALDKIASMHMTHLVHFLESAS